MAKPNPKKPKPGALLARVLSLIDELLIQVEAQTNNQGFEAEVGLLKITKAIESGTIGVDQFDQIHGAIAQRIDLVQSFSDKRNLEALMLAESAARITQAFMARVQKAGGEMDGSTFSVKVVPGKPNITFDKDIIAKERPGFIKTQTYVDREMLKDALDRKEVIPGVSVKETIALEFSVNKKERKNVRTQK